MAPDAMALVAMEDHAEVSPLERPQSMGTYSRPEAIWGVVDAQL